MSIKMTNAEYDAYVKSKGPASPLVKNLFKAFTAGGIICCFGQAMLVILRATRAAEQTVLLANTAVMVFIGALLTALHVYDRFAKFGGAGTLVPITGFANSVAAPAIEFKSEGVVAGMAAKMFIIAGPVIVFGVTASVIYGVIYYFVR